MTRRILPDLTGFGYPIGTSAGKRVYDGIRSLHRFRPLALGRQLGHTCRMADPRHPAFFGYGSLVNRATHDYAPGEPALLRGWRRTWRHTRLRPWPYLSAEPAESEIEGLVAAVPGDDWALLDQREAAYRRHTLAHEHITSSPGWADRVEIYAVDEVNAAKAAVHPILLSYLDTVVQGFLREFGEAGVARFFATTTSWTALLDDREEPIYSRHQRATASERALTDGHAEALGLARRRG
ncbi:gamma-glutamylcyclotransferase family protein [Albidovulum aquaemixtae]|uniref:gamma-glutamylcyclotransferase family protein n=1 Tax=Albidovulum aquaemixtae TaxID=1542388 RepID=UPI0027958A2A|nr:gamma-glutamylcyclotransferase family protein [Defluviimonas aquaemixtae]